MVPLESPTARRRGWTLDRRGLPDDPDLQHGEGSVEKIHRFDDFGEGKKWWGSL